VGSWQRCRFGFGFAFVKIKMRAITSAVASRTRKALGVRRDGALDYLSPIPFI